MSGSNSAPNSNYSPLTYEARLAHSLAGTILIDSQRKRRAKLSGQITNRVEFGYGLLGHIDNGGTIEIERVPVGLSEWQTAPINIQLSGRLVSFKTISQQQYETRSDFRAVSGDLSLLEGATLDYFQMCASLTSRTLMRKSYGLDPAACHPVSTTGD